MFKAENNKLYYIYDNQTVCIEPWGKNALRVRYTANRSFTENDWALTEPVEIQEAVLEIAHSEEPQADFDFITVDTKNYGRITNGKVTATINLQGAITFTNDKGDILLKESWTRDCDRPSLSLKIPGRELIPGEGDNYRIVQHFLPNDGEKIFGMGQYQQKYLDMKGCTLELAQRNSQASVPFYISSLGYGFLWNNPAIGEVSFAKNGTKWVAQSTRQADYWIVVEDTPDEIEERYTAATGRAPMMPDYGMGFWQCKLRYRSQEELLAVARKHKSLGLPMDVIVADYFHWPRLGDFKFDEKYWPDPAAMCRELKEMGIELMVSVWPTIDYRSENFSEMMENGYLVRTERGVRITMQVSGQQVFMDPTNPGTRAFVWKKLKENYWDKGVRIFWLDEAEPEYTVYDFDNYRYYLGTDLEVGNIFPACYSRMLFDGMKEMGVEKPLNLVRCAWAGSAKYGVLAWSGDVDSTWDSLQRQVRAGMSMAVAGIPWWTTDIGGFHGRRTDDLSFRPLLMRWFQFGAFSPVFRLHGVRNPRFGYTGDQHAGVGTIGSGSDNEVWSYGEECFGIMKKYLLLRERLRPYIKEQMERTHTKGTPIMRPLFYDFSKDAAAWDVDDQYMFGPDLLVAPVLYENQFSRKVYLPAGAVWTNAWTGEEYVGGQTIEADAPIDTIPLFVRDHAALPIRE